MSKLNDYLYTAIFASVIYCVGISATHKVNPIEMFKYENKRIELINDYNELSSNIISELVKREDLLFISNIDKNSKVDYNEYTMRITIKPIDISFDSLKQSNLRLQRTLDSLLSNKQK